MNIRWLYSYRSLVALFATAMLAVGLMTVLVIRQQQDQGNGQVYLEAGGSIGSNPFVPLVVPPAAPDGGPQGEDASFQVAAPDRPRACDSEKLIAYLTSDQGLSEAEAWVRALNYDRSLSWSGGSRVETQQISAYIHELTPRLLTEDLRVTNYQFTNGVALPVQSVLEKGTAILVDARGIARVRCVCGNPLTPMVQLKVPPVYRGKPWPNFHPQRIIVTQVGVQGTPQVWDRSAPPEAQHWQDRSGSSDEPRRSEEPGWPDERPYPDQPGRPEKPEPPERPEAPQRPEKPEKPVDPDKPSLSSKPQYPSKPAHPAEIKNPEEAEESGRPGQAVKPVAAEGSRRDGKDQETDKPQQRAGRPASPAKPAQPPKPPKPTKPDDTAQTGRSGRPHQSAVTDQDNPEQSG